MRLSRTAKGRNSSRVALPFRVMSGEPGVAMIIAVLGLALIFLICMVVVTIGIGELQMSQMARYSARAQKIAEAGISRALIQLRNEAALSSSETTDATLLNWPHQALDGSPPVPSKVHKNDNFAGGKYQVWLYQDPAYPADHAKKVIVSWGAITAGGVQYTRTLESKVNYASENPNYFDAFNFLVYNGNESGNRTSFDVTNYFGSYSLDGIGQTGDGWGIYSVGDINLTSHLLGLGSVVYGNVISEDDVTIGGALSGLHPPSVRGTVYAGIDNTGGCDVYCDANILQISSLYVGKVYASQNVTVNALGSFGPTSSGAITIDRGIECGGKASVMGVVSGSVWGGGVHIGHMDKGPTDGIKARGGVEVDGIMTAVDIGDIESGYFSDGGNRVGVDFNSNTAGTIYSGNIKSTGYLQFQTITGGITTHDIWAGTNNGNQDGTTLDTGAYAGYLGMGDLAARGKVKLWAGAGGFGVGNVYAGYLTDSGKRISIDLNSIAGGYSAGVLSGFGKVAGMVGAGGSGSGGVNAGTENPSGNGGVGCDLDIYVGGTGCGDIKSRGRTNVDTWFGGVGVGNITAGTDQAGLHGGTGISFTTQVGGASMKSGTCVGRFEARANAGGATIDGNITAGTNSTTLLNGQGTGGDGVYLNNILGAITVTGSITSRGRVPLQPTASFGLTVKGNITAGTDAVSGNGGTGVRINANVNLAPIQVWGNITSRGMVNIDAVLSRVVAGYNPNTGAINTVTAGTNSASLDGGEAINISNTVDLSSIVDWPDYGHLTGRGRVKLTATAGGIHVNGAINAGYCDDATWGRNGVLIDTSLLGGVQVGNYSGGIYNGITSVGKVVLNCNGIAGYFNSMDIAGLIRAGHDHANTVNSGGTGVDIRASALGIKIGSSGTGGITSTGRTDFNTSWGQGIEVRGACKIGSDSESGRDYGFSSYINSQANILWGGITISGLLEASSPVRVRSVASRTINTNGIYAGMDRDSRNSGHGVWVIATAGGTSDNGTIRTQDSVYLEQSLQGTIGCRNITAGPNEGVSWGDGIGLYVSYSDLSVTGTIVNITGTVTTRGKVKTWYGSGIIVNCDVRLGLVVAGSDTRTTAGYGVETHGITGGTIYFSQCHSHGQIYLDDGIDNANFNYHLTNVWCGASINWSWDHVLAASDVDLRGYLRSAGDIYLGWNDGGTEEFHVNVSGGINCGGTFGMRLNDNFYADGGINAVGGVRLDTWGETIRAGTIKANWIDFNMDDGSWQLNGSPALMVEQDVNLSPNQSIDWSGNIVSEGHVNINTDGDENVKFGKILSKLSTGLNFDDGDWDIRGGIETQQWMSSKYEHAADIEIWNGIWAGGYVNIDCETDYWAGSEGGMRIQSGGIRSRDYVAVKIPKSPDPGYVLQGGITALGAVSIDGNARAGESNQNLVDSGGIWSGGNVSLAFRSDDRDGEWGYVYGDVRSPSTVSINSRREQGGCSSCVLCLGSCDNNDPGNWEYFNVSGAIYRGAQSYTARNDASGNCSRHSSFLCYCNHCEGSGHTKGGVVRSSDQGASAAPTVAYPPDADFEVTPTSPGTPSLPSVPTAAIAPPTLPPIPTAVDNLIPAASGGGELPLPSEPAMPAFGGARPSFPNMATASGDLPAWMNYTTEDAATTTGGLVGQTPGSPPLPTWGPSALARPDFENLLPFGGATAVKMPRPQWDWWRAQAQAQGEGHYFSGDATLTLAPSQPVSTDEIYFAEGNVTISSLNFPNDSVVHKATVIAYGYGNENAGDINVTSSTTWKIYGQQELHLMAMHDVNVSPSGFAGALTIGDQAVFQMWAGRNITVAMSLLSGILGTGTTRGNLVAGNHVELTDPTDLGIGWYRYSYYRPTIKADGWVIPYRNRGWRELSDRNWTDSTPSG